MLFVMYAIFRPISLPLVIISTINQAEKEAKLSQKEQDEVIKRRIHHTPTTYGIGSALPVKDYLENPNVLRTLRTIATNTKANAFLTLYQQALDGRLDNDHIFVAISLQFAERTTRLTEGGPNALKGMRYSKEFADFCTIMRSYGGMSATQYSFLRTAIGGLSMGTLRCVSFACYL